MVRSAALPAYPGAALSQPEAQPTELCWWGAGVTPPICVTSWDPCWSFCSIAHHSAPSARTTPHFSPNRQPQLVPGTAQTHLLQAALHRLLPVRSAPRGAPTHASPSAGARVPCMQPFMLNAFCALCAATGPRPATLRSVTSDGAEGSPGCARPRPGTVQAGEQRADPASRTKVMGVAPLPRALCEQQRR